MIHRIAVCFLIIFLWGCGVGPGPERVKIAEVAANGEAVLLISGEELAAAMEEVMENTRISACGISHKTGTENFFFLDMQAEKDGVPTRLGIVLSEDGKDLYLESSTCLHQCAPSEVDPCRDMCRLIILSPCEDAICHCAGSGDCNPGIYPGQAYNLRAVQQAVGE